MKSTLTNNLLVDLFQSNRNAALEFCRSIASLDNALRRADDPDDQIQLLT